MLGLRPLVSVVTPVLNGRRYLVECIESVLTQSYPQIEHIFVDGGSTDGTLKILENYSLTYPSRVRFITGQDKSAEDAWNKGICAAEGQILGWLGADDVYCPEAIEAVVEFFNREPESAFVFGGCDIVDQDDRVVERAGGRDFDMSETLYERCAIPTPSAFFKREVVEKIGLLDTSFTPSDFDYWIRVGKCFRVQRIDRVLSRFRKHSGSISGSNGMARKYARIMYQTSRRHGGPILSRHLLRCLILPASDFCRPVLGPIYPPIKRLIRWR